MRQTISLAFRSTGTESGTWILLTSPGQTDKHSRKRFIFIDIYSTPILTSTLRHLLLTVSVF